MAAITLDTRVMVQALAAVADAGGGHSRNWSDFRAVWAQVRWGRPDRASGDGSGGYRRSVTVTLRWAPDLPDPMRLIVAQRPLAVVSATRLQADPDYVLAECEEQS